MMTMNMMMMIPMRWSRYGGDEDDHDDDDDEYDDDSDDDHIAERIQRKDHRTQRTYN